MIRIGTIDFFSKSYGDFEEKIVQFPGFVLRQVSSENDMNELPISDSSLRSIYLKRFKRGHKALVGYMEEAPCFLAWVAINKIRIDEIGYSWKIPLNNLCLFDVKTDSVYRGKGIYTFVLRNLPQLLTTVEFGKVWIYCEPSNIISRKGIVSAGYHLRGKLSAIFFKKYSLVRWGSITTVNV